MAVATNELDAFVKDALQHASKQQIDAVLREAGWPADQIKSALDLFADTAFPIPVPKPRVALSAQEAFLYLIIFSTLYFSAYHLGSLSFDFINRALPDPAMAQNGAFHMDGMRWSIASLVIAFPVFLWASWHAGQQVANDPVKRLSPVRRWLTYITLFIAAAILIGDLTTLVYNVLGGELASRFLLKVATVAIIAGTIFGYYLSDLRRVERTP